MENSSAQETPRAASLRGRQAEALRNDAAIVAAAREVFLSDPAAPMAAVAAAAGVGVGGLYRRYAGKDELLQRVCGDGLRTFVGFADEALADTGDAWAVFERFLQAVVDSDVHALTMRLAGTFRSTEALRTLAARSDATVERLVRRTQRRGGLRRDVTAADLPVLLQQLSAVAVSDPYRTGHLRRRYLRLVLDGLRVTHPVDGRLPGPGPSPAELGERWARSR